MSSRNFSYKNGNNRLTTTAIGTNPAKMVFSTPADETDYIFQLPLYAYVSKTTSELAGITQFGSIWSISINNVLLTFTASTSSAQWTYTDTKKKISYYVTLCPTLLHSGSNNCYSGTNNSSVDGSLNNGYYALEIEYINNIRNFFY